MIVFIIFLRAKRIRAPDPRITNSEVFGTSHINQCLANAKRGLSLCKSTSIRLWWYKSGYRESVGCGFLIAPTTTFLSAPPRVRSQSCGAPRRRSPETRSCLEREQPQQIFINAVRRIRACKRCRAHRQRYRHEPGLNSRTLVNIYRQLAATLLDRGVKAGRNHCAQRLSRRQSCEAHIRRLCQVILELDARCGPKGGSCRGLQLERRHVEHMNAA